MRQNRRIFEYVAVILISVIVTLGLVYALKPGQTTATSAESALDRVLRTGVLRAAVPASGGLPYATRDASGNMIGYLPDVWAELAKSMGVRLEMVDTPDASRIPFMQAGQLDVAHGTITLMRAQAVSFSNPINVDGTTAAVLKSSGITTYEQAQGMRVATISGGSGEAVATKLFPTATVSHLDGSGTALQALKSGQVDVDIDNYTYLAAAAQEDPNILVLPTAAVEPAGLMVPYGDSAWAAYLNYFLNDYWGPGVSTCGCGHDTYVKWFKAEPLPVVPTY
jgi:polar amino acid transport system substrate-binding protein